MKKAMLFLFCPILLCALVNGVIAFAFTEAPPNQPTGFAATSHPGVVINGAMVNVACSEGDDGDVNCVGLPSYRVAPTEYANAFVVHKGGEEVAALTSDGVLIARGVFVHGRPVLTEATFDNRFERFLIPIVLISIGGGFFGTMVGYYFVESLRRRRQREYEEVQAKRGGPPVGVYRDVAPGHRA